MHRRHQPPPPCKDPNRTAMIRGRRRHRYPTAPAEALPDDLLVEILLRLPPQPSSLPCAGLVCKRWRRLVTDICFIRRFHAHHRTPPLLGYFAFLGIFAPIPEPPCRVPPTLSSLDSLVGERGLCWWGLLDCRHGFVLSGATRLLGFRSVATELTVFNPMIGDSTRTVTTGRQIGRFIAAAVVAVAGDNDRRSFCLVALFSSYRDSRVTASVYSSESGVWVHSLMDLAPPAPISAIRHPSSLVGNAIYWLLSGGEIIQFDLERQSLAFIEQPPHEVVERHSRITPSLCRWIIPARDGHLGLAVLSERSIQFWERKAELTSVATWKLCKTVQLDMVLPQELKEHMSSLRLIGFAEESNVIFICTPDCIFMAHIELLQFRKVHETSVISSYIRPYSSF